jgi:hypothetical protein
VVVDGIDGRTHHVDGIDAARVADARIGSVVEIGPADTASRPSDRTIATVAEGGVYRPSRHLEQAKFEGRVPGGDYDGYVDAHVRRLEALRRAGIVERIDADQWRIPDDFESRAAAYDAGRNKHANIRILSAAQLEQQIGADGATWLDRRLMTAEISDLAPTGFGLEVRQAIDRRRPERWHALSTQSPCHAARAGDRTHRRRDGCDEEPAVPRRQRRRDRQRQIHRDRPAIERQVRRRRAEPRVHPCPVAPGHRPPTWP